MALPAIHRFERAGKRFAIDPETCFCFECDAVSWDVLDHYPHEPVNRIYHLLSGGLFLGAFFMATDYVTSPLTRKGLVIYAIGIGALIGCIRLTSSAFPEGVCFAILIMNTATALVDRWTIPRIFGSRKK